MSNFIQDRVLIHSRLNPIETELTIQVEVVELTPTTEIKGKLVGPRCAYATTVEIAYPLRETSRSDKLEMRVVIPEPSWWEPKMPFLYQGPLELWQDGQLMARETIRHGIRDLRLSSKGLTLNGRPLLLRGRVVEPTITEAEIRQLHDQDVNLVMVAFRNEQQWLNSQLWSFADRFGMLVLCCARHEQDIWMYEVLQNLFTSVFACVAQGAVDESMRAKRAAKPQLGWNQPRFGVEWTGLPISSQAAFVLCRDAQLPFLSESILPKIVLVERLPEQTLSRPDVIGWIESP